MPLENDVQDHGVRMLPFGELESLGRAFRLGDLPPLRPERDPNQLAHVRGVVGNQDPWHFSKAIPEFGGMREFVPSSPTNVHPPVART